jgi:hypothetical protein
LKSEIKNIFSHRQLQKLAKEKDKNNLRYFFFAPSLQQSIIGNLIGSKYKDEEDKTEFINKLDNLITKKLNQLKELRQLGNVVGYHEIQSQSFFNIFCFQTSPSFF